MSKDALEARLKGGAQRLGSSPAEVAADLAGNPEAAAELAALLDHADPRVRGGAAESLARLAEAEPAALVPFVAPLAAAIEREETQTRLGAQRALAAVSKTAPEALEDDFDVIRLGVFDPAYPDIRRHAALAIGRYGAGDEARGRRAFPHLAEALRRFHDRQRPADLLEGIAILARAPMSDWLKSEIWKAARKHENHADPAVRTRVKEIAGLVRPAGQGESR